MEALCRTEGAGRTFWVITSPNCTTIPMPILGVRTVKARRDGCYALDDCTQHPQYYVSGFEYICCIPRRPDDPNDPLSIMWFMPSYADVSLVPGCAFEVFIYTLNKNWLKALASCRDEAIRRSRAYKRAKGHKELLSILIAAACHCYSKLEGTGMSLKEVVLAVAEFQQAILDVFAWVQYVTLYYPHLFPPAEEHGKTYKASPDIMGAFTKEVLIAEQLCMMGVPVWLVRPSFQITPDTNIDTILQWEADVWNLPQKVEMRNWLDDLGEERPFPIVYQGLPCNDMHRATQCIGCRFTDLREASRIGLSSMDHVAPGATNNFLQNNIVK